MKNRRNSYNRNLRHRKYISLNRRGVLALSTFTLVFSLLCSVSMVANAKEDEQPLYKYYQSYMVEKDDTLLSIAYNMNTDKCSDKQIKECVDEMISINSLDHKGTICYGNYIIVPYYSTEYR